MTLGDKILTGVVGAALLSGATLFSVDGDQGYVPQETKEIQAKEIPSPVSASQPKDEKAKVKTPTCHPGYSGCLNPDASDYDCAGGSGNGPYYTGQVQVYGSDPFDLDRDGDGIGCE